MNGENLESIIFHMRTKQLHWQEEPSMYRMTISEMIALERWLLVAEAAPESVAVGQALKTEYVGGHYL